MSVDRRDIADWDAAYVLGALSREDRHIYEAFLAANPERAAALDELAGLPGRLNVLSRDEALALIEPAASRGRRHHNAHLRTLSFRGGQWHTILRSGSTVGAWHSTPAPSAARSPSIGSTRRSDYLAKDVRWTIVGYMVLEGADAVRQTCRETAASLEDTTTTYDRCVVAAGSDVVAVDTFARYSGPAGVTAVASCDIYEFAGEEITAITSYAVEVDPESAGSQPPPRQV